MLLALEFLRVGRVSCPSRRNLSCALNAGGVRSDRLRIGLAGRRARSAGKADAAADAPDLQAGHEAFEIALLLVAEIG